MKFLVHKAMPLLLCLPTLAAAQLKSDKIYHYSTMDAMRNAVYTGDLEIGQLKQKGNFGLGTFNLLDGEMIAIDGIYYRVGSTGEVKPAANSRKTPFASVTKFKADTSFEATNIENVERLQQLILKKLPSTNRFYAIKIHGTFQSLSVGGATKVAPNETQGLANLMKKRPMYNKQNISGTIIGFYTPNFVGGIDLSPFHFHFISDDKNYGGHLVEGDFKPGHQVFIQFDEKNSYEVVLPNKTSIGYKKTWQNTAAQNAY